MNALKGFSGEFVKVTFVTIEINFFLNEHFRTERKHTISGMGNYQMYIITNVGL